jgi:hypothetical protein
MACRPIARQRPRNKLLYNNKQWPTNSNKGMVFSVLSVPMTAHATMEYVMPLLWNNCGATEERCFIYAVRAKML